MYFLIGDYSAGMLMGVLTALGVRAVVWPGMDMVMAMVIGTAIGMALHLVMALALAPVLGMFQTMIPASLIGMYGGMLFAMRDAMAAGSQTLGAAVAVGAIFGALMVLLVRIYDRALRAPGAEPALSVESRDGA